MTLAAIFTACALLASPTGGPFLYAVSPPLWQSAQPASPTPTSPQEPPAPPAQQTKPETPAKTDQAPAEPQAQSPAPAPPPASPPVAETSQPPSQTPPSKTVSKKHRKKKMPATPGDAPTKVVVRNGSTTEPTAQISPGGVSKEQASHEIQSTTQLLASTNTNLQKLSTRQLNSGQQDTVKQIRTYMDQAKAATDAGDLQRAHNLASKAQLLSDDLLKQ